MTEAVLVQVVIAAAGLFVNVAVTLVAGGRIAVILERRLATLEERDREKERRISDLELLLRDARILMLGRREPPATAPAGGG